MEIMLIWIVASLCSVGACVYFIRRVNLKHEGGVIYNPADIKHNDEVVYIHRTAPFCQDCYFFEDGFCCDPLAAKGDLCWKSRSTWMNLEEWLGVGDELLASSKELQKCLQTLQDVAHFASLTSTEKIVNCAGDVNFAIFAIHGRICDYAFYLNLGDTERAHIEIVAVGRMLGSYRSKISWFRSNHPDVEKYELDYWHDAMSESQKELKNLLDKRALAFWRSTEDQSEDFMTTEYAEALRAQDRAYENFKAAKERYEELNRIRGVDKN